MTFPTGQGKGAAVRQPLFGCLLGIFSGGSAKFCGAAQQNNQTDCLCLRDKCFEKIRDWFSNVLGEKTDVKENSENRFENLRNGEIFLYIIHLAKTDINP